MDGKRIETEDGRSTPPKEHRLVVAVKGWIRHAGRVLLIRREPADAVGAGTWEPAGGKIDFGEQPEAALVREIHEETGLRVNAGRLLYAASFLSGPDRHVLILSYLCSLAPDQAMDAVSLSDEHDAWEWADAERFRALVHPAILGDAERFGVLGELFAAD